MLAQFINHIDAKFAFLKEKRLLLACSGGVDSVVLAHLCIHSGLDITLAHCNFNLRAKESDDDALFVQNLADQLGIGCKIKSFDTKQYIQDHGGSVQMAARELRYKWFNEILDAEGFGYVMTAHHADDSLETFLINLSRGTGIDGLSGIPIKNGRVVRPLLDFSRKDILDYANAESIEWRKDSSNAESKYLRNKIRQEIAPKLKELHPTFLENFKKTQTHLHQTSTMIQNHIDRLKDGLFEKAKGHFKIKIESLNNLAPLDAYLYQLFNAYGFTEWKDVKGLLSGMSGKEVHSQTHRLIKDREYLLLSKKDDKNNEVFVVSENDTSIDFPVLLKIEEVKAIEETAKNVVFLDKEKLNYPLMLRNWEKGDYFYPFGMNGKKKLSKFFKDEKVDVLSKEKQWLLCSDKNVVWVIGRRLDERYKVDGSTKDILKITFSV
ncbi:tRNA lysidine(34) synthetase TilS [Flagellimonas sp. CMM7]|uniref:tRNA lysidine(34) synthetase TilS n=1 Tax=Flagellimonas sp. CMM7 TaxID=2654676 RepID=UPI0013D14504|nr:tRNA lysidine(34) synthetase TilS [Flagellimonas sp. CMM7]UII79356.1 tRNA lysidine(34) synthetase TilS [Flagellimonas sp. CMM7]